jgi:Family of unknown function (DUF5681)
LRSTHRGWATSFFSYSNYTIAFAANYREPNVVTKNTVPPIKSALITEPKNNGRFKPGNNANPKGRPLGSRHKKTVLLDTLLDAEGPAIIRAIIEAAKSSDPTAMKLCAERINPPRKGRPVVLDLPKIETAADVVAALSAITSAVASGHISPEEGEAYASLVETTRRAIETSELQQRLEALEERLGRDEHQSDLA